MGDLLHRVLNWMGKVVHRIDAPFIPCIVVGHMGNPVDDRISHINIRRCHVYLGPQHPLAILAHSVFHLFKQLQVLFYGPVPVWAVLARLRQGSPISADFFRTQVADIGLSLLDQFYGALVHHIEIVGCKVQVILPVCPKPFHIFLDRLYKLHIFFGRVRIVKS